MEAVNDIAIQFKLSDVFFCFSSAFRVVNENKWITGSDGQKSVWKLKTNDYIT
jgi:hypothetical protein